MAKRKLSMLDSSFLQLEAAAMPMHIAGLSIFTIPEGKGQEFVGELVEKFRACKVFRNPWNYYLKRPSRFQFQPELKETFDVDMEYHVRHLALPRPGGERELGQIVARVHSQPLDFRRPLWEVHFIEGLENNRFAVYMKMHHCLVDGVSGMRLLVGSLSDRADDPMQLPFWAAGSDNKKITPPQNKKLQLPTVRDTVNFAKEISRVWLGRGEDLVTPRSAPKTVLNGRIYNQRRFATHVEELPRIKAIAEAAGCSLNDLVLALSGTVLREYLLSHDALPRESLTVSIPVSLHQPGDTELKNNIAQILASLGTNIADDKTRLEAISRSTQSAKDQLQKLPHSLRGVFGSLVMAPYFATVFSGLAGRVKPSFNIIVSNVPGPQKPLYLFGAKMEHFYPVSIPTHGSAMNLTCFSYDNKLHFGLTACRDSLPQMQRMAVALGEAVDRYEELFVGKTKPRLVSEAS
ncbi:wax ester/triacylglycerol synthase family O-acyltransferase [Spongiibacter sp. KMU-158]|uniref:diacylglycerol O-acyltransferase n=1 Tax=Spongiibacter pelagi TaxID=2760804 RepID=A0A927C145_9GAMM|nr:wax ester/triacylglycerol synthase family O-acyltransferase [Spongiibacter pelagi]MBD2858097.1 wax ester/triacylglycerol synthase family O-acyltransferase [Spongiibacter pelagi]